jgi:poly(hydroxyalkanoate) granule-associated protein
MVKKLKKMAEQKAAAPAGMLDGLDSRLAGAVKASAQQIWLAGMGAFAKAQEEGGKVFEALVKEGVNLQRKTQSVAEDRLGEVTGKMSAMAGEVTHKAGASWDKLEGIFESRTAKALAKLGVPNSQDLAELHAKVDALSAAVAKLGGKVEAPKKPATKKAAAAKPAAKRAAKPVKAAAPAKKAVKPAAKAAAKPVAKRAPAKKAAASATPAAAA